MDAILTGIYTLYGADATLKAALTGGLYLETAPQSADLPYATMAMISGRPDYYMGGRMFEVVTVQFDLYAATNAGRMAAYNALTGLYDDARPSATGYTSILMERVLQQMVRDGDQNQIFRAVVTYDCRYLKG